MPVTYVIPKKNNRLTYHDIASDKFDRVIKVPATYKYGIILSSYYGGKGYSYHRTPEAVLRKVKMLNKGGWSHVIVALEPGLPVLEFREDGWGITLKKRF